MAEFTSSAMVVEWIYSGGTVSLGADHRTVDWQPTTDFADSTAGSDTTRTRLATIKDATAAYQGVGQTGGTVVAAALAPGTPGTLIIGPEGTASTKRKITFPCFAQGAQYSFPYADVVTLSCSFVANGAWTDATY